MSKFYSEILCFSLMQNIYSCILNKESTKMCYDGLSKRFKKNFQSIMETTPFGDYLQKLIKEIEVTNLEKTCQIKTTPPISTISQISTSESLVNPVKNHNRVSQKEWGRVEKYTFSLQIRY